LRRLITRLHAASTKRGDAQAAVKGPLGERKRRGYLPSTGWSRNPCSCEETSRGAHRAEPAGRNASLRL